MVRTDQRAGFTITEMVVATAVMSVFITMFFQVYTTNVSQQQMVAYRARAFDIAVSNLNKITTKSGFNSGATACDASSSVLTTPGTTGKLVASDEAAATRTWTDAKLAVGTPTSGIDPETVTTAELPSAKQELRVAYPRGCAVEMPIRITSIVKYTYNGSTETVSRVKYVNL